MKVKLRKTIVFMSKMAFHLFLLSGAISMALANSSTGQGKSLKNIEINMKHYEGDLSGVLMEIEKSSDFQFAYLPEDISGQMVQLDEGQWNFEGLLMEIASQTQLFFRRTDEIITIHQSRESENDSLVEEDNMSVKLTGRVTDENGEGLPGVTIIEKNTSNGTVSDFDGQYTISVDENAVLIVSFVGFVTEEIAVGGRTLVNIEMSEDIASLEEVVVVGYGTQKKEDVTGAIATISAKKIEQRVVPSVESALQGVAPGINVGARSASPGELPRVTIRAIGSLSAGYEPLWVVDGFPTDQRNAQAINPADIASVEILKDASSTAIYGSRGANGVIIITTKSGKEGKSSINLSIKNGISYVPEKDRLDVLNAEEYVQFATEKNGGIAPDFINDYWDGTTDTDWQDELLQSGAYQDYSVSASGGGEKVSYLLSSSYINQEGVIPNEGFDKYSAQLKLDYRPTDRITIGLNLAPNYSTIVGSSYTADIHPAGDGMSAYEQAISMLPIIPTNRADGSFAQGADVATAVAIGNPLETVQNFSDTEKIFRMLAGLKLSIEPMDGLIIKSTISTNLGSNNREILYNAPSDGLARFQYDAQSFLRLSNQNEIGWLNENTVNFRRDFGDHSFDLLAGLTFQSQATDFLSSSVNALQVQGPTILSLGDASTLTTSNGLSKNTLASSLGRINYSFKDKYLITGTVRRDGSSRFGSNNRYQTFGSFALGWRVSEENFIKSIGLIDNLKIRGSYGTTGSNSITDFIARPSLSPVNHSFGSSTVTGVSISSPGNSALTWETSTQLDLGLDLSVFKRFDMIFDYYSNETTSLLLSRNTVPSSGFTGFLTNIGSMRNRGVEVALNAKVIDKSDFEWSVGGNVTHNDQEILDLGGDDEIRNFFGALRRTVGGELQNIHLPKAIGISDGSPLGEGEATASGEPAAGAIIYEDVDGDGVASFFLGPDGQTLEDGINVDWTYGFNTSLRYKNFDLSALFVGQAGASVIDLGIIQVNAPSQVINVPKEVWFDGRYISASQPGDGMTPAPALYNDGVSAVSTLGVQKTDYLRFQNLTIGYNIPEPTLKKYKLKGVRVYTSIENIHTWTDFVGGNPDERRPSGGGPSLFGGSRLSGVSDGLELGLVRSISAPIPRVWLIGVNINF